MELEYTFTDKNRDVRDYHTIRDDEGNTYSKILFHKVRWHVIDRPDITELDDRWAEKVIQYIIDGCFMGEFEIIIRSEDDEDENDDEDIDWFCWKIMTVWDGWNDIEKLPCEKC